MLHASEHARGSPARSRRRGGASTSSARSRVAVADRLEELAVLADGVVEPLDAVEREEPDAQREHVVLLERRLEERVVRAAVDVPVDPLVEVDQASRSSRVRRRRLRRARRAARRARLGRRSSRRAARRRAARAWRSSTRRTSERPARSPTSTPETKHARAAGRPRRAARARASRSASRTGVRPTPSRSIRSRSLTTDPGGSSSVTISSRIA